MLIRSIEDSIKDHLMKGSGFFDSYSVPNMSDVMHHPLEDVRHTSKCDTQVYA